MRMIIKALIVFLICGIFFSNAPSDAASHKLSEYKKLFVTIYLFPKDKEYLAEDSKDIFLTGDIDKKFNKKQEGKLYLKALASLKKKLTEKGFVIVESPDDADAIAALNIHFGYTDPIMGKTAQNTSLRVLDPATHDTLMIIFTRGAGVARTTKYAMEKLFDLINERS